MNSYRFKLHPKTAFGTPLLGETLFGSLCWGVVHAFGEERLNKLLDGYTEGRPFCVISDAFPSGFVPLPVLPQCYWKASDADDRKYLKKKAWLCVDNLDKPVVDWRNLAKTDAELLENSGALKVEAQTSHNTINRATQTTGEGMFAPYEQRQLWLNPKIDLDIYVVLDEERFSLEELTLVLQSIGLTGFGKDASIGLGKYEIAGNPEATHLGKASSCTALTLASSSLGQIKNLVAEETFYRVKTHFGRHGAEFAIGGLPFKKPILLAQAGALLTLKEECSSKFLGEGLTGISNQCSKAVHQGYSPVIYI